MNRQAFVEATAAEMWELQRVGAITVHVNPNQQSLDPRMAVDDDDELDDDIELVPQLDAALMAAFRRSAATERSPSWRPSTARSFASRRDF